jgi:hypothetical protein
VLEAAGVAGAHCFVLKKSGFHSGGERALGEKRALSTLRIGIL